MKTVVVTGAGSGIGFAIASELASEGYGLILMGRDVSRLEEAKQKLAQADKHCVQSCDVRDRNALDAALQNSGVDTLYGVVINAGVGGENQAGDNDRWQEIIDTNLSGSYHTLNACLPFLKKCSDNSFRKVVFVSSILARLGVPGYSAYCASKAGILGLMRSMASQLAGDRILVNALCPGWVDTAMAQEGIRGFADALGISKEEARQQAMEQVPLGKMSTPEEIANFVVFLMSDAQTSLTGQTLDINNGAMMP